MADRKKSQKVKLLPGGKNSSNQPPQRRNLGRRNILTPQIWLPYRAGHGATARDKSIADKTFALLKVALEERLGTPLRAMLEDDVNSEEDVHCDFCQREKSAILYRGPKGRVCVDCFGAGLESISLGERWPVP